MPKKADRIDSQALYKSLFDNMLDGLAFGEIVFDAQGSPIDYIYLKVNKNFQALTGLKNVVGKKVTKVIPEIATTNPDWIPAHARVAMTGKPERFEAYVKQASGWFLLSLYSTEKNFLVSVFQNITAQKQIEKNLENAQIAAQNVLADLSGEELKYEGLTKDLEKFKLATDNASDQIVITDPEGITLYINPATERLTGYETKEIMGKKVGTLWGSLMPKEFYQDMWKTIKTDKRIFIGELRNRRKNGELYDAELRISPVLDKKNNVLFFVGIERDVSVEKRLVKEKDEALAKDDAILSSIGDGLVVTDRDGKIILVNQVFESLMGWKKTDAIGRFFFDVIPRQDENGHIIPWSERVLQQVIQGKLALISTLPADDKRIVTIPTSYFIRKDGTKFPVTGVVSPIYLNEKIIGAIELFRDITKEQAIDRAKNEFVSLASHQLRTPPSIIGWYTETLKSGDLGQMNKRQNEYLDEIYKANERMIATINSLLNISRIEMGTFAVSIQKVDIKSVIEETIKELTSRFKRTAEWTKEYGPGVDQPINADPNIMHIIIDNLLSNAFKYGPPENTKIEVTVKFENNSLLVSVKDNGIGIAPKDQGRVFEKLFRADNAVSANPDGTGLGLYMVKKIVVDGLGGKIWFDSKENEGATFCVSLPAEGMKEKPGMTTLTRVQYYQSEL